MANPAADPAPPHEFPFWPFSCMAFYSHVMRDFGRYGQAMTQATNPMQTVRAESDYGLSLWKDMFQAYYDLALLPMTLAAKASTTPPMTSAQDHAKRRAAE